VRKELTAGIAPTDDIYTPAWTERTYAECLWRAEVLLFEGKRVIVDANFVEDQKRILFLDLAARMAIPACFLHCHAEPAVVRRRLAERRGDVSDADWSVYQRVAQRWEEPSPRTQRTLRAVVTDGLPEQALTQALAPLHELRLVD
jgi:hypothetical protein